VLAALIIPAPAFTLSITLTREGADGQAVVCQLPDREG
jgi:hypothetical protein